VSFPAEKVRFSATKPAHESQPSASESSALGLSTRETSIMSSTTVLVRCGLAAVTCLVLDGCALEQHAPIVVHGRFADVYGQSRPDVERIALAADEYTPRVQALLCSRALRTPEIVLTSEKLPDDCDGICSASYITLHVGPETDDVAVLIHELAHWNMIGCWSELPTTLREGVADAVLARVAPRSAFRERLMLHTHLQKYLAAEPCPSDAFRDMDSSPREFREAPYERKLRIVALADEIAEEVGIERMNRVCRRISVEGSGRASFEGFLHECGFEIGDGARLRQAMYWLKLPSEEAGATSGREVLTFAADHQPYVLSIQCADASRRVLRSDELNALPGCVGRAWTPEGTRQVHVERIRRVPSGRASRPLTVLQPPSSTSDRNRWAQLNEWSWVLGPVPPATVVVRPRSTSDPRRFAAGRSGSTAPQGSDSEVDRGGDDRQAPWP
jgi:hypothetical protein